MASVLEYSRELCLNLHVRAFLVIALACAWARLDAEPATFSSGPYRVALIELYTSEGCSSCPPADAWLGKLRDKPGLWTQFVPVQFHVDYWDGLGWKDPLATREFTAREHAYASAWGGQSVYTPCFVRNGVEWRPQWGTVGGPAALTGILALESDDGGAWRVSFTPGPAARSSPDGLYEVHIARLGGGIYSKVTAGENGGSTLEHEFVVLGVTSKVLSAGAAGGALHADLDLPRPLAVRGARRAIAAWITPHRELEPVQAAGGWLP
jgi:hypothetical protein